MVSSGRLVGILALLLAIPSVSVGGASAAPPNPASCSASIAFDVTGLSVAVSASQPTEAFAGASVFIAKPSPVRVTAILTASTDLGWPVAVTPASIVISGPAPSTWVKLAVEVPAGEAAGTTARVTLDVALDAGYYPCTDASSSELSITVSTTVERFNGYIVADSLIVTDDARRVAFRVEFEASANAAIQVSIKYVVDAQVTVDAPQFLVLNPQIGGRDNTSIEVALATPRHFSGSYDFAMLVRADVEGHPPIEGELGMTVYVPRNGEGGLELPVVEERMANALIVFAATLGSGMTMALAWWLPRRLAR